MLPDRAIAWEIFFPVLGQSYTPGLKLPRFTVHATKNAVVPGWPRAGWSTLWLPSLRCDPSSGCSCTLYELRGCGRQRQFTGFPHQHGPYGPTMPRPALRDLRPPGARPPGPTPRGSTLSRYAPAARPWCGPGTRHPINALPPALESTHCQMGRGARGRGPRRGLAVDPVARGPARCARARGCSH